ncbi:hypothetical protein Emed_005729 [Eimeria media]
MRPSTCVQPREWARRQHRKESRPVRVPLQQGQLQSSPPLSSRDGAREAANQNASWAQHKAAPLSFVEASRRQQLLAVSSGSLAFVIPEPNTARRKLTCPDSPFYRVASANSRGIRRLSFVRRGQEELEGANDGRGSPGGLQGGPSNSEALRR